MTTRGRDRRGDDKVNRAQGRRGKTAGWVGAVTPSSRVGGSVERACSKRGGPAPHEWLRTDCTYQLPQPGCPSLTGKSPRSDSPVSSTGFVSTAAK